MFQNVETEEDRADERSVEDLLSYINGGHRGMHECWPTVRFMLIQRFILALQKGIGNYVHWFKQDVLRLHDY